MGQGSCSAAKKPPKPPTTVVDAPDGRSGNSSFRALILAAADRQRQRKRAEAVDEELIDRLARHRRLYDRWISRAKRDDKNPFPPHHPIYRDMLVWELYVCRSPSDQRPAGDTRLWAAGRWPEEIARPWFAELSPGDRIDLCEMSRDARRKIRKR